MKIGISLFECEVPTFVGTTVVAMTQAIVFSTSRSVVIS